MDPKKCFKFQHEVFDNLNIAYNPYTHNAVFWNKYQIFFFEDLSYESLRNKSKWIYVSEFIIVQVTLSSNYIICLDSCGNLYISPLKFKLKKFNSNFQKREKEIVGICHSRDDFLFSLQKSVIGLDFCVHKINREFELTNKIQIFHKNIKELTNISYGKILCQTYTLNETQFIDIRGRFQLHEVAWNNQILAVISFDHLSVYAGLLNFKTRNQYANLIKLFSCPSQLINVSFIKENKNLIVLLGLASGTLILIPLSKKHSPLTIIHLNTAIAKFISFSESIIYTDGISLWKTQQTYSELDISFKEFIVKQVKDFIKVGDNIVCVTYSKLIYLIVYDDESCYAEPLTVNDYCPSEYIIDNLELMYKVLDLTSRSVYLKKELDLQKNYTTAILLSNRTDILKDLVEYKITVFETYEDIIKEEIPLSFTNNIAEYFNNDSVYFLIKITTLANLEQKYIDVLSNLFGNLKIHVTLLMGQKVLKTTSVKVNEFLRELNLVVPLNARRINLTNITVNIIVVTPVPGCLNERETLWAKLHYQTIILNSEHFIKCSSPESNMVCCLKEQNKSIKELILETARNHHGRLFKINEDPEAVKWTFYVTLPTNYEQPFTTGEHCFENLSDITAKYIISEISSEEFLKSGNTLSWTVGNERVDLTIFIDVVSNPLLKVTSANPLVAHNIRNFFSNLAYSMLLNYDHEYIDNDVRDYIRRKESSFERCITGNISSAEFVSLFQQYQENVMGAIVI